MDNISFTSKIRLVPLEDFRCAISTIGERNNAKYPWTIKQSVLANNAYTKGVIDCTVCGLTDGSQVLLNHICPDTPGNLNFSRIADFIKKKMPLDNPNLQGFLLGAKIDSNKSIHSEWLFDKFAEFLEKHRIPFSQLKGGPFENHVAYFSSKDEWLVGNAMINPQLQENLNFPEYVAKKLFDKVDVCEMDKISW